MVDKEFSVKLLNDNAVSKDAFKDQTHQNLANTLFDVITSHDEGMTIGLEGSWGSGKSTIVSLLKNKLNKNSKIHYFYFDAWEHEGDPLRRIFLEELIKSTGEEKGLLKNIKNDILDRKNIKITTKKSSSVLGRIMAIATLFVPIGIAIVSGTINEVVFYNTGVFHWKFISGALCAVLPLIILMLNFLRLLFRLNMKVTDPKNWVFIESEVSQNFDEVSIENNEKTSIEFEDYFKKICELVINGCKKQKLVVILDNLDRVNAEDSLKIWSTMQTFLQKNNPSDKEENNYNKIWTIVPYDSDGLKRLWDKNNNNIDSTEYYIEYNYQDNTLPKKNISESFFDKCFQLRLHVPHLIMDNWEDYCLKNMDIALTSWSEQEKNTALDILKWTRVNLVDTPTPREIKTFINQLGVIRKHADSTISIEAIAYYVNVKYLFNIPNKVIEEKLRGGSLPDKKLSILIKNENIRAEICGIQYGVSPDKGKQILLEEPILKALTNRDVEALKKIFNIHVSSFWTILIKILTGNDSPDQIIRFSNAVYNGLYIIDKDKCSFFADKINQNILSWNPLTFPQDNDFHYYKDYYCTAAIIVDSNGPIERFCELLSKSFIEKIKSNKENCSFELVTIKEILSFLPKDSKFIIDSSSLSYEQWGNIALSSEQAGIYLTKQMALPEKIFSQLSNEIKIPDLYQDHVLPMIYYARKSNLENWDRILDGINKISDVLIKEDTSKDNYYLIIEMLYGINDSVNIKLKKILEKSLFWHNAYSKGTQTRLLQSVSLILGRLAFNEFDNFSVENNGRSSQSLSQAKKFWKTSNIENAKFIWGKSKPNNDFVYIWQLAKNKNNVLIGDIIWIAIDEKYANFFNVGNPLENYFAACEQYSHEIDYYNLASAFYEYSKIENEILKVNSINNSTIIDVYEQLLKASKSGNVKKHLKLLIDKRSNKT